MKEKIIKLLEDDYCKLSRKLTTENDKQKKDFIIGAMGYISNLQKKIEKISENNGLFNNMNLGQLTSMMTCSNCGFSMYIYAEQERFICEHCGNVIDLRLGDRLW